MFVLKLVYEALLCNVFICIILLLPDLLFHTPRSPSLTNRQMFLWEGSICFFHTMLFFYQMFPSRYFAVKGPYSQSYGFPSSHVQMWKLDHKKAECQRNAAFQTVGEDSWEPLGLQGNQPWIFIIKTNAEAEVPTLWPPDVKSWLIR